MDLIILILVVTVVLMILIKFAEQIFKFVATAIFAAILVWFAIGLFGDPKTSFIRRDANAVVHGLHSAGEKTQHIIKEVAK